MSKSHREITERVSAALAQLRSDQPELQRAFGTLAQTAIKSGALDSKTKELIALALGVGARCDACIGFHTQALLRLGATRAEVEEALGVAVYMGGGPSLMYAAEALSAYYELSAADEPARA